MTSNVGTIDAGIRWFLALALFALSIAFTSVPAISLVAAFGALIMVGTALTHRCPLYTFLGVNTCPRSPAGSR